MAAEDAQFLNFPDLSKDMIEDKIDGDYNLLAKKIENLQQQNDILSKRLDEAQVEIVKLHGKNDTLTILNGQMNVKFGEISNEMKTISKQNKQILKKIENTDLSHTRSSSDEAKSESSSSKMQSNYSQLSKEIEDLNSNVTKMQDKVNEMADFQANLNITTLETNILAKAKELLEENMCSSISSNMNEINDQSIQLHDKINEVQKQHRIFVLQKFETFANQICKSNPSCFSWKISGINEIVMKDEFSMESEQFPVPGYPFKAKAKFEIVYDEYAYISLAFIDEDSEEKQIPLKVIPKITFALKALNGTDRDLVRCFNYPFGSTPEFDTFHEAEQLRHKSWLINSTYNLNNFIVFDIAIEPPSVANTTASNDGMLTVAIDNYNFKKQRANNNLEWCYASPYFYTSTNGFRVKIHFWLNEYGDYEGKGVKAELLFLKSENDSALSRPFAHKVTVIVFNQLDSTKHYKKTLEKDIRDECDYFVDLLPHDKIENGGFVDDGNLYYKVIIQPQ